MSPVVGVTTRGCGTNDTGVVAIGVHTPEGVAATTHDVGVPQSTVRPLAVEKVWFTVSDPVGVSRIATGSRQLLMSPPRLRSDVSAASQIDTSAGVVTLVVTDTVWPSTRLVGGVTVTDGGSTDGVTGVADAAVEMTALTEPSTTTIATTAAT